MEHSALHGLQLTGLILALAGPFLVLALLGPARRALGPDPSRDAFAHALDNSVARWTCLGAVAGGLAVFLDLFVQVAEVQGQTVFGGVELALVARFATQTTVGQLAVARITCLALVAAATRLPSAKKWGLVVAFGLGALWCTSLVSHAAAQPSGRVVAVALQIAHLAAAAAWVGVLVHLFAARALISAHTAPSCLALTAEIVRRFSPVALTTASLLAASGVLAAVRNLHAFGALVTSAYGLTLSVKLLLLVPALVAGFINYRIVRPNLVRLSAAPADSGDVARWTQRFRQMLELEVTAGLLVITVAGIVGSVSPPGADGALRLTPAQVRSLLTPALPHTTLVDPAQFVGAAERTVDDLMYAEFMHQWSGVFVIAMGLLWLAQGAAERTAALATRLWPFLLVPFAVFISAFADPEVWVLRTVSFRAAVSDPVILEHQLGAVMVLVMVWLGWRDQQRPPHERPLGPVLPILIIAGSLLLLGHAHSGLRTAEEFTNLINVQHAVLGSLGLLAGTVRWLSLRALFPQRAARILWPVLVIALGFFMTFCYREIT